jgi:hypothetical protein
MNEQELLEEAEQQDDNVRACAARALECRQEVLKTRGWVIDRAMIGPTVEYFYTRGDVFHICEHEALAEDE